MRSPRNPVRFKPFGSVFWHNMARSTWYIAEEATKIRGTVSTKELKWQHRKNNRGDKEPHPRLMTLQVDRAANSIQFAPQFVVGKSPSTSDRVRQVLIDGPKSRDVVRTALFNIDPETIQKAIRRGIQDNALTELPDGRLALKQ